MSHVKQFEDLQIWKDSRIIVGDVYKLTSSNDRISRDFGFKDQLHRAAVSVMNNIAEGFERDGDTSFKQFLGYSKSSCGEVRSMIYLAKDLGYIKTEEADDLINRLKVLSKQIYSLMKYLND
ncbi:MAG TPA: four helix bundle protein [Balneolaceae bacterium]|nr:four helix bundle protein [Balneolaceae bacterium]